MQNSTLFIRLSAALTSVFFVVMSFILVNFTSGKAEAAGTTQITGFVHGFTVPPGETYEIVGLVETDANVLVKGTLKMRPGSTLRFVGVNEAAYVGGGMEPRASDGGLWGMDAGRLDIQGTRKVSWNRTGDDATWRATDELLVTPTATSDFTGFAPFVKGNPVPSVYDPVSGETWFAEVFNITRDVVIEGTQNGRAHVLIRSTSPQTIKYARFEWLGPQQGSGTKRDGVLGRYPVHFHHCMNGSRGSEVIGNVVMNSGHRAFVPHVSHGILMHDNIAYNIHEDAFWYDRLEGPNDVTWSHNLVAKVTTIPSYRGYRLAAFWLGSGVGNTAVNNVAVGVQGNKNATGYVWPEIPHAVFDGGNAVWEFAGNVAHNNKVNGIFTWQNTDAIHVITDFVAYRNGRAGIEHGAYITNGYRYGPDIRLHDNGTAGIIVHAAAGDNGQAEADGYGHRYAEVTISGAGDGIVTHRHNLPTQIATLFKDIVIGVSGTPFVIDNANQSGNPGLYDLVRVTKPDGTSLTPSDIEIRSVIPGTILRLQESDGTAWQMDHQGQITPRTRFYIDSGNINPPPAAPLNFRVIAVTP